MSKTIADLAKLLGSANSQLFDRYISFRLTRVEPGTPGVSTYVNKRRTADKLAALAKGKVAKAKSFITGIENKDLNDDFIVVCPADGIKPSITVSASFHVQNTANLITLTVVNMNANIDTMAYNYAEIEVGYINSGIHTTFSGQITNCYMAKPNPNGELVVSVVCANISNLYKKGAFKVAFTDEVVPTVGLIQTCIQTISKKYPVLQTDLLSTNLASMIPGDWLKQTFTVAKATYAFNSPLECITWLNSLFASATYNTGFNKGAGGVPASFNYYNEKFDLPPLRLGFDTQGKLTLTSTFSEASPGTVKALSCIGSAFLTGTNTATITAPFNPNIAPGEVIYIDPKYFKTRVTVTEEIRSAYKNMGNLWYVVEMQFTFATTVNTNTMILLLNNISNKVTAGEG